MLNKKNSAFWLTVAVAVLSYVAWAKDWLSACQWTFDDVVGQRCNAGQCLARVSAASNDT